MKKLGCVTLGLVLWLSTTAAWPQELPQAPIMPPTQRADSQIADRPSSVIPSTANITVEQLYTLINERDRQYQQRFEAQEKAVNAALIAAKEFGAAALSAAKEAVNKADAADEKRFDSVNEFRAQQKDLISTFMSRSEMEARFKSTEASIDRLDQIASTWQGRVEGINWVYVFIGAVGGGLLSLLTFLLKARDSFRK